jgi:hypothetical protein
VYGDLEGLSTFQDYRFIKSEDTWETRESIPYGCAVRLRKEYNEVPRRVWTHKPQVASLVSYGSWDYTGAKTFDGVKRRAKWVSPFRKGGSDQESILLNQTT